MVGNGALVASSAKSVAIIGAGPAGAIAALQLARAGCDVSVVAAPYRTRARIVETLSPTAQGLLSTLAIWSHIPSKTTIRCPAIVTAWEKAEPSTDTFLTNPYGCPWHIDRATFDRCLIEQARAIGVCFCNGVAYHFRRVAGRWHFAVTGAGGNKFLATEVLILATGRSGRQDAFDRREVTDHLWLLCLDCDPSAASNEHLLIEATRDGWWYSAPSLDKTMFVGWITNRSWLRRNPLHNAVNVLGQAHLTSSRINSVRSVSCVAVPISGVERAAGEGWLTVGDRALARDPISGDGIQSAIISGLLAATAVIRTFDGDPQAFSAYEQRQRSMTADYLRQRASTYQAAARRWPSSEFWSMRSDRGQIPVGSSTQRYIAASKRPSSAQDRRSSLDDADSF